MPQSAIKFPAPPIESVLQLVFKSDTVPDIGFDPEKLLFKTLDEALAWRNSISADDVEYLAGIDRFVAQLTPDETIDLNTLVKPENKVKFYRCLFYVLIGCNILNLASFSDDFSKFKLNESLL